MLRVHCSEPLTVQNMSNKKKHIRSDYDCNIINVKLHQYALEQSNGMRCVTFMESVFLYIISNSSQSNKKSTSTIQNELGVRFDLA